MRNCVISTEMLSQVLYLLILCSLQLVLTQGEAPTITETDVDQTMSEETPVGTPITWVFTAADPDMDVLSFSLTGADASFFLIDPGLGIVTMNSVLDVDATGVATVYKPVLSVSDGNTSPATTATLTLTLSDTNDNQPACTPSVIFASVDEETSDTVTPLLSLTCADADLTSPNNDLAFSIVQGDTSKFSVSATGDIFVTNPIDYETTVSDTLEIKVADQALSGVLSTTATVVVTIRSVNDNAPAWGTWSPDHSGTFTYAIDEDVSVGTTAFTLVATDADTDTGGTITYSITSVTDGTNPVTDAFNFDPSSGAVTTLKTFDRDSGISAYTINVEATDTGTTLSQAVTVNLNDVNDNIPVFSNTPFAVTTIAETAAKTGSVITTVSATDGDVTASTFAYSISAIVSGTTAVSDWSFSGTTAGQLELASDLDLDAPASASAVHVLKILVKDGAVPELTGTGTLTVSISPDNEFTPTIASVLPTPQPIQVAENTGVSTSVAQVTGADSDSGDEGTLTYSIISGDTAGAFTISSTGEISIQTALDRETTDNYNLVVQALDSGVSAKSVTTSVSITITDVNDNPPICSPSYYTKDLPETSSANAVVTTLTCTDADSGDTLAYSVNSPNNANFGFTTPTNELKLTSTTGFDYDSATQAYDVEVTVTDGTSSTTARVRVNVGAVNDVGPTFATIAAIPVTENVVTDPLVTYTASDSDFSPHDVTSYIIQSVTNGGLFLFGIDSNSGVVRMLSSVDYDTLPAADKTYELEVVATDGGGSTGTGTVTVTVGDANDNAPTCSFLSFSVTLDETQGGSGPYNVATLGCTDVEDGTTLTYSLTQTPGTHFTVAADVVSLTTDSLNYEADTAHTLTIKVVDGGAPALTTTVTLYVSVTNLNDGPPVFPVYSAQSIDENIGVAQSVTVVTAIDPDGTDPSFGDIQYSIIGGDTSSQFSIDVDTGLVKTRKALDFETTSSYSLVIQAIERGGTNSASVTQVVNLNDVNDEFPACSPSTLTETVAESEVATFEIRDLGCTDGDAGTTLVYTITSGDTTLFEMSGSKLLLKAGLDFETAQSHQLTIQVSDGDASHDLNIVGTVNVGSVDEGPPVFSATIYPTDVNEAAAVGDPVVTVTATDPDSNLDANGQVQFSFVATYSNFALDAVSGQITIAQTLNRETAATHTLLVKAEDATGSNTATVSVTVLDSNDNTPSFTASSYSASVAETDPSGTTILTVTATDADDPATNNYGTVTYSLSGSSNFNIDSSTGIITTTAVLDADTGPSSYLVTLFAVDSGGTAGALTGSVVLTITVTTNNQHDPVFSSATYAITITESQFAVGDIVITVTCSDADTGTDGVFTLSFVSPQTKFSLTQNGDNGEVRLDQILDFDSGDTAFSFEITALDQGTSARSATTTVSITVDDVNDNNPLCTSVLNPTVVEGQTSIATLSCSDADPGTSLTYSILSTTPGTITPAVSGSGVLSAPPLDYENGDAHTILVKVQDDGVPVKSTTVTVNLQISDLNDNDPSLSGSFAFTVSEADTAGNSVLYTAVASGNDGATDTVTYSLSDTTFFDITPASGEITLKTNAPDYETSGPSYTYSMDVCAVDTANPTARTACQTITVTITDANDESPQFNPAVYSATVQEDASLTDTLATLVTATDSDISPGFNTITYSITAGNTGGAWSIDNTGTVSLAALLDFETTSAYTLVIQASDGTNTASANYNIQVTGVNEATPVFTPTSLTVNVDENSASGTAVPISAIPAADADSGVDGQLTYSIDSGPLTIDPTTGAVTVISTMDRETTNTYVLNIRATDQGATPNTGILVVTVNVNDLNDNTPSCSSSQYAASILESAVANDAVTSLVCVDDDSTSPNNALTYTIVTGDTSLFTIDVAGQITVNTGATFDRETTASYSLVVDVADQATSTKLTSTVSVTVTILDANDNTPTFASSPTVPMAENTAVGTTITTLLATDGDSGTNAQLDYQITGGNSEAKFSVDPTGGHITLKEALDFETTTSYVLVITATDRGSPPLSGSGSVTVSVTDVNDRAPQCATSLYTGTVAENSVSQAVVTVACTDQDTTGTLTYSITSGNTNNNFEIDAVSGALTTAAAASIDYETTQSYTLEVTVSDSVQSVTVTVQVTVTDVSEFPPVFVLATYTSPAVPEDTAAGVFLLAVAATDQDLSDTVLVYSITGGNTAGNFYIDSITGDVNLGKALDYETTTSYSLTVQAEDAAGNTGTAALTIPVSDVNDNSPTCAVTSTVTSVDEGSVVAGIFTPTCSDADTVATPTLEYSITTGAQPSIDINSASGELSLNTGLDYETATSYDLVITVSDKDTPTPRTTTIAVTINVNPVNENDPVFTSGGVYGPISVAEDTATDTSIAKVSATDADTGLEHGTVRYSIVSGDAQQQFGVDATTGDVKVVKQLDREATTSYSLTVRATDDSPGSVADRTADATVTITVTDVNDNSPRFSPTVYTVDVVETDPFGPAVVLKQLTVLDDDDGVNAALTITITSGNAENKFSISGTNLILSAGLDFETTQAYNLVLEVTDGGTPPLNNVGQVAVNVLSANEQAPLVTETNSTQTISESTPVGTLVYDANATDTDSGTDGVITYSIASGVTGSEFVIDSATGQLVVGSALDFDIAPTSYAIIIKATDGAGASDATTSTVSLSVILTDENDNYPQFTTSMFTFNVNENVIAGTAAGTVVATDADTGVNGNIVYTKTGGSGLNYFDIDASTGEVTTAGTIDYEAFQVFFLSITAHDGGTPSLTSTGLVKIQINNENDNAPTISPQEFAVILPENSVIGTAVHQFTASDLDTAVDGFSLAVADAYFQVNSATGEVTTKALLDRETVATHTLFIQIIDQLTTVDPTVRTTTATLTVIVEDSNDNDPIILGTYSQTVDEDAGINQLVFTILATDADAGANAQLSYAITAGNTGTAFKIDSIGNVQLAGALDRETLGSYSLTIEVSDQGTPSRSDQIVATVTVGDINDNDPVFNPASYSLNVDENSVVGSPVGSVTATDADQGANAALVFSFDSFTLGLQSHFAIDGASGAITVASASLDRETTDTYTARVKVTDSGATLVRTAYTDVTITINDLNDNPPVMSSTSYSGSVDEGSALTTSILQVTATDQDIGVNKDITYSLDAVLLGGAVADTFLEVDASTGVVTPKSNIDYETHQSFNFIVTATDGGTPALSATATVTVTVNDVNDNSPVFSVTFYNREVAYSAECETSIVQVTATDADSGDNARITYSLQANTFDFLFNVASDTGILSLQSVASANTRIVQVIQASDNGSPINTAATGVTVRVDTFVPNNIVVTIRTTITSADFMAESATFLANMQTVVRTQYPSALVRLWCVQEYAGIAQSPATGRRRLLTTNPVDVNLYVVSDASSESQVNINTDKTYLTQDQFRALIAANAAGDPAASIQGAAWDYYNIVSVSPYFEDNKGWWDTIHGIVITVIAIALGLVLLALLTYMVVRCCNGGARKPKPKSKVLPRMTEVEPKTPDGSDTSPKPILLSKWNANKGNVPDADIDSGPVRKTSFPPMFLNDPLTDNPTYKPVSSLPLDPGTPTRNIRSPRNVIISANDDPRPPRYSVVNREFDGKAYDPATGKMFEYNTTTNEWQWME